jgi:hypothetical protein
VDFKESKMDKDKIRVLPNNNQPTENIKPLSESELSDISLVFTNYAKMQWDYFNKLKAEGFNDEQALKLIMSYHPLRPQV